MKKILKKIAPPSLKRYAAEKKRTRTRAALKRLSGRNIEVGTMIDVGASDGQWSLQAMDYFPDAQYLLVEANDHHKPALEEFCASHRGVSFEIAAASNALGEVAFDGSDPFGGQANPEDATNAMTVRAVTLDSLIGEGSGRKGPYFLKLDTHGYELPILEGAQEVLKQASLVVIETYNFHIAPDALLFHEMVAHMRELGFGVTDISDPLWRPGDQCFWQIDLYFQPLIRDELQQHTYL